MLARTSSAARGSERLAERRRQRRRRARIALSILGLSALAALLYGLREPAVRIHTVDVFGVSAERQAAITAVATSSMQGFYGGIIPRDSIFFFPEDRIRSNILALFGDAAAVSIFRSGFTSISIKVDERAAVGRWCGLAPTPGVEPYCYLFDANGLIYAAAASTTEVINSFALYAPPAEETLEPLGETLANADSLPATFDFARELATFGSPVSFIVIRDGEVNMHLTSGTRVSYVLGSEQSAFTALVSAKDGFDLTDGSVEYVDLRFDGKVYLKRKQ